MALATNVPRSTAARVRVHATSGPQPLVKSTHNVQLVARPALQVVPRGRRAVRWVTMAGVIVFALMLAAAAFQTQLARRQLQLDQLNKDMDVATQRYDALRRERAELRSPGRLTAEARNRGMTSSDSTKFVPLAPEAMAEAELWMGQTNDGVGHSLPDNLDQYELIKGVLDGRP